VDPGDERLVVDAANPTPQPARLGPSDAGRREGESTPAAGADLPSSGLVVTSPSGIRGLSPVQLWQYRELLRSLVSRNLKVKYQRSTLGFLWTLFNPLVTATVLILVFSHVLRIGVTHFWAFLMSGFFAWHFLQSNLATATQIMSSHGQLRRSVAFPDEILLFASAIARLVEFGIEIVLVVVVLTVFHHQALPASFALLPVLVLLLLLISLGLMLPLASLSVFYSDVQHAMPPVLLTFFYLSPVFYPIELVPESVRPILMLNPMTPLLTLYHVVLFEGRWPSVELLAGTAGVCLLLFLLGYAVFNRYKPVYAEIV
jgi:ABC-2 type transport system permease protein